MKTVQIEKQYKITLAPEVYTQEFVNEFESYMWELEGDTLEEKLDELHAYAARMIAQYAARMIDQYDLDFIEGIGPCASIRTAPLHEKDGKKINVVWEDTYEDVETEVSSDVEVE